MNQQDDLVGATLETILLGPLLDGRLRYWAPNGTAHLAAVDDEAGLRALMGRGLLARTSPEPDRFREVGLFDAKSATLYAIGRPTGHNDLSAMAGAARFSLSPAEEPSPDADPWPAAADWWRDAFVGAAGRGEFIVVEPGGWEPGSKPYALALARREPDGTWLSYLEAAPATAGGLWPPSSGEGSTIHAPISAGNLAVSGLLIADAVRRWALTPFDTVITFGTNPDGPVEVTPQ